MNWRSLDWVTKTAAAATTWRRRAIPAALCAAAALVAAQSIPACSSNKSPATTGTTGTGTTGTTGTTTTSSSCDHPNPGCSCATAAEVAPCGKVVNNLQGFVECSMGTTTCTNGTWGACTGDVTITDKKVSGGGITLQGLGKPVSCSSLPDGGLNPCDPFCNVVMDNPPGVDAGAAFTAADSGLRLTTNPSASYCNEPTNSAAELTNLFTMASPYMSGVTVNPLVCTGGQTDTCPFDYQCSSATTGTCAPYAQGTTNTHGTCTTLPDFTLGLGCWDSSAADHSGLELEVCNRGGVVASAGSLRIDLLHTQQSGNVSTGCPANSFPNAPKHTGGDTDAYCNVDLANAPLAAGECISFNVFNPPAHISCLDMSANALTASAFNFSTNMIAIVNPATATANPFTPGSTQLTECDVCNNYGVVAGSSLGQAYAACNNSLCGTTTGTGQQSTLCNEPTTVTTVIHNDAYSGGASSFWYGPANNATPTCTAGVNDNCEMDSFCNASSGGTCVPYAAGGVNKVGTCVTKPDFTIGTGCWDSSSSTGLELEVCNRGGVVANTGTLYVDMVSSAPSVHANGRACPQLLQSVGASTGAYCAIPLTTTSLASGECVSFNIFSPAASTGIKCYDTGGTALSPTSAIKNYTNLAAVVNPQPGGGFTPSATVASPLSECDTCNNYTEIDISNLPTGTPATGPGACQQTQCGTASGGSGGSNCLTTLSGTVMDPGLNVGLSNIEVYVPTATPANFVDPVGGATPPTCDSCASLNTAFTNGVATAVDGSFHITLPYTSGSWTLPYGLVIQTGRWRRWIQNVTGTACQDTNLNGTSTPNYATTSLPYANGTLSDGTKGDIPKIAIVTGQRESTPCLLNKIGIATNQFSAYNGTADSTRITLYSDNGESTIAAPASTAGGTSIPAWNSYLFSKPTINNYSLLMFPCNGSSPPNRSGSPTYQDSDPIYPSVAEDTAIQAYADHGGRLFFNHLLARSWIMDGPATWNAIGTWDSDNGGVAKNTILNTTPDQVAFYNWASIWDVYPSYGPGYIYADTPYDSIADPLSGPSTVELAVGSTSSYSYTSWFNTPTTGTVDAGVDGGTGYCGRVVVNNAHVSSTRASGVNGGTFPSDCAAIATTPLTSEELALEYEFFQVTACNLGVSLPIPPPPVATPPVPLGPTTFTRTFQATCAPGYAVKWGAFQWQASIPSGTSIAFTAQTAPGADGGGAGTYGAAVPIGTASATTTTWTQDACTVDGHLENLALATPPQAACVGSGTTAQQSQAWLKVSMLFTPTQTVSPVLTQWQQLYDCVP